MKTDHVDLSLRDTNFGLAAEPARNFVLAGVVLVVPSTLKDLEHVFVCDVQTPSQHAATKRHDMGRHLSRSHTRNVQKGLEKMFSRNVVVDWISVKAIAICGVHDLFHAVKADAPATARTYMVPVAAVVYVVDVTAIALGPIHLDCPAGDKRTQLRLTLL